MGNALFYGMDFAIFFAALAMLYGEGIWSNVLTLINIVVSGIVAFGFFGPLTIWMVDQFGNEYRYVLPIVAIWAIFVVTFVILQRGLTGLMSTTKMKFITQLDNIVGGFLAAVVGFALVAFSSATLHIAPLPVEMFAGHYNYNPADGGYGHPDLAFLKLTETALGSSNWGAGGKPFIAEEYIITFRKMREDLETKQALLAK